MTESEIAQLAQPAPRRRDYSDQTITQKPPALTELTLLRYITFIGLATYITSILFKFGPFLEFLRNNHRFVTWTNSAFVIFSLSLASLLFAIIVNKHPIYTIIISIAMVAYLQLAIIQITELIIFHDSPWDQLHLGDLASIPTCLTVSILHRKLGKIGMIVAIIIIPVMATSQNVNSIMLRPYVFDVLYSTFIGTPWIYMVHHVVATSRRADKAAFDEYQALTSIQRSNQLKELETTSLSNIHDRILSTLNNINKGVADPEDIHTIDIFDLMPTGSMPLTTFIQNLKTQVGDDTRVVMPESTSDTVAIPMEIAATMLAAIEQAYTNSIAHAPQAQRELVATWDESQLSIVFADTGPGFHVAKIPHHHAGVTITMLERPRNHPGVSAQLTTAGNIVDPTVDDSRGIGQLHGRRRSGDLSVKGDAAGVRIEDHDTREVFQRRDTTSTVFWRDVESIGKPCPIGRREGRLPSIDIHTSQQSDDVLIGRPLQISSGKGPCNLTCRGIQAVDTTAGDDSRTTHSSKNLVHIRFTETERDLPERGSSRRLLPAGRRRHLLHSRITIMTG